MGLMKKNKAFLLIEVLVAFSIFALFLFFIAGVHLDIIKLSSKCVESQNALDLVINTLNKNSLKESIFEKKNDLNVKIEQKTINLRDLLLLNNLKKDLFSFGGSIKMDKIVIEENGKIVIGMSMVVL
jgi:hypothetical protein